MTQTVRLAQVLESLRRELSDTLLTENGTLVRFEIPKVEIELQVAITCSAEGGATCEFRVPVIGGATGEASVTIERESLRTIRCELKPLLIDAQGRVVDRDPTFLTGR
jgi:hypothetical protein